MSEPRKIRERSDKIVSVLRRDVSRLDATRLAEEKRKWSKFCSCTGSDFVYYYVRMMLSVLWYKGDQVIFCFVL